MAKLINEKARREYIVPSQMGPVLIGRGSDNDIILRDGSVSREHAAIQISMEGHQLYDRKSKWGTYLNGERVGPVQVLLEDGDKIQLGRINLTYHEK